MSHNVPITATQLAQSAHVSKETGNQLALVTDPYHDYPITATGFPDGKSVFSVAKRRNARTTIICPFTLAPGETWDFHVFTTPLHDYGTFRLGYYDAGNLTDPGAGSVKLGPVNILCRHYSTTGTILNAVYLDFGPLPLIAQVGGQTRTVSLGYEIHDTSPTLDKQGTISSYRINQQPRSVFGSIGSTAKLAFPHDFIGRVPESLSQIMINPTAHTWELRHGVYGVSLPAYENEYHLNTASSFVLPLPVTFGGTNVVYLDAVVDSGKKDGWSPLLCAGSLSSKLPSTAVSYSVDFRQTVELLPDASDTTMMYATTCPEYNNQFAKMYKLMIYKIPAATKVNNNASGDWFRAIASIARTVAPMALQVLPPQAKALATLAAPLANYALTKAEEKITKRANDKKPSGLKSPPKKNG